jgi:type IV pilus assembly protein PilW
VYLNTSKTYRLQDGAARMQEGARFAFELISNDLRMAGTTACGSTTQVNVINTPTDWHKNLLDRPVSGLELDTGDTPTENDVSDALRILRADISNEYIVSNHDPVSTQFTTSVAHGISDGALMVATDCNNTAVFQATSASGSTVNHATAGTPGNSTADLGSGGAYTYGPNSRLYRLSATTYYIANNPASVPSLYRLRPMGSDATPTAEELVEGVEDVQFAYGVDTTPVADGVTDPYDPDADGDPYATAAQIDDVASTIPGADADERWLRVVSVRVSFLMRSIEDRVVQESQNYVYNGSTVTAPDLRLRKVFTHVVKLRNR